MRYSKINTLRILLLLPLVLLHLQTGIALLHHHHRDSWYDQKDPAHSICKATITPAKCGVPSDLSAPAAPIPMLPAADFHVAVPNRLILGHILPAPSVVAVFEPTASFPNRASPA